MLAAAFKGQGDQPKPAVHLVSSSPLHANGKEYAHSRDFGNR
jgi:hypothetical protein